MHAVINYASFKITRSWSLFPLPGMGKFVPVQFQIVRVNKESIDRLSFTGSNAVTFLYYFDFFIRLITQSKFVRDGCCNQYRWIKSNKESYNVFCPLPGTVRKTNVYTGNYWCLLCATCCLKEQIVLCKRKSSWKFASAFYVYFPSDCIGKAQ